MGAVSFKLMDEIDQNQELSFFIQTLVEECTLGLLLIFNDKEDPVFPPRDEHWEQVA